MLIFIYCTKIHESNSRYECVYVHCQYVFETRWSLVNQKRQEDIVVNARCNIVCKSRSFVSSKVHLKMITDWRLYTIRCRFILQWPQKMYDCAVNSKSVNRHYDRDYTNLIIEEV